MTVIENYRQLAFEAFKAGIRAADPKDAIVEHLPLHIDVGRLKEGAVIPIAVGKAAIPLMEGMLSLLPVGCLKRKGLVITNRENLQEKSEYDVFPAGHPLPDDEGLAATAQLIEVVKGAREQDHILIAVSGGASAMLPAPRDGISLADKIAVTDLLLASGADISAINIVRKHLSNIKGGGLSDLSHPAQLTAFILSDVVGDDLSSIASGPTVPDPSCFKDVKDILTSFNVWEKCPIDVRDLIAAGLEGSVPETGKEGDLVFEHTKNILVGSNRVSLEAMRAKLRQANMNFLQYSYPIEGEAREEAERMVLNILEHDTPECAALVTGGETTVTLAGKGKGGRNQEFALAFALAAEKHGLARDWVFLSGGTDGRDGPTDAAGGMVDSESLQRMRDMGIYPEAELKNNNAYEALMNSSDLLMTGGTGTNVTDLQLLIIL